MSADTDSPAFLQLEVLQVRMHLWRNADGSLGAGIAPPEGADRLAQAIAEFRIPVPPPLATAEVEGATPAAES